MKEKNALSTLNERISTINDVLNSISVLTWDSRTMMPAGGAEARGNQIATLTELARRELLCAETERALEAAEQSVELLQPGGVEQRMVVQTRQAFEHHRGVPAALIRDRAALRTVAHSAWVTAREQSDFSIFAPYLEKTIALSRAYAGCIGWSEHPYDAMVSIYEPGETTASLKTLFAALREGLLPILDKARSRPPIRSDFLYRNFPKEEQRKFCLKMAGLLGFDFDHGRLDTAVHPFEVSFTRDDVRITTRYNENYLCAALFGTAHETGHALYEQHVDPEYTRTAFTTDLIGLYAVGGTSFGAHESQSRLLENHIVRSRGFWQIHFPELQREFPAQLADVNAEEFYRAVTRIEPGLIRVEADELTYDFHVMLRVEIECALMDGSLDVADLPQVWNAAIKRDLGLDVPNDRLGVLQDIHWSTGYIGSFPSYTTGNVMAAQLMDSLHRNDVGLGKSLEAGDYAGLRFQLEAKVWTHGRRFTRDELLQRETGSGLRAEPYLDYLRRKYTA